MNSEIIERPEIRRSPDPLEPVKWLGRRDACGSMAGRCSAAEIASLRVVREQELYRHSGMNWDEFCSKEIGVSRKTIDKQIAYLEEFGPAFFQLNALAHVTPQEFRAIRGHVSEAGLAVRGETIALAPENSQRVLAAVTGLRAQLPQRQTAPPTFEAALKRCEAAVALLDQVPYGLDLEQKLALAAVICRLRRSAAGLGAKVL